MVIFNRAPTGHQETRHPSEASYSPRPGKLSVHGERKEATRSSRHLKSPEVDGDSASTSSSPSGSVTERGSFDALGRGCVCFALVMGICRSCKLADCTQTKPTLAHGRKATPLPLKPLHPKDPKPQISLSHRSPETVIPKS